MTELLTAVPPTLVLAVLAVCVVVLPTRLGHALGTVGALGVAGWILAVPGGAALRTTLFGFDAVLFHVDVHSRLVGGTFAFLAAAAVAYLWAGDPDRRQTALALAYVGAGLGAIFAGDWLTLVVFWELMAVSATVLIWYRSAALRAGLRYAVYHELGALALIAGVLLQFDRTGSLLYGGGIEPGLPALLVVLGIGLNAGFLGLHVWVVDAYPRAHPGTSVVLAAITTKVGAFTILRAFPDGHPVIAYMGGAMVLFGVSVAILQTDMRRLLSYHIVSQVGYIVAGFGVGLQLASAGATLHLMNNVLYKSLLFMVAGVLIHRTGNHSLKSLGRLGPRMPMTAGVFLLAAASIAGLPGFNGFVSKGMIVDGVEKSGFEPLWYVLILGGVGTVISFSKFGYYAFLTGPADQDYPDLRPLEVVSLGGLAGLCLTLGVVPGIVLGAFPADAVGAAAPFAGKQFVKVGAVTAAGLVGFLVLRSRLAATSPVPDLEIVYHPIGRRLQRGAVDAAAGVEAVTAAASAFVADRSRRFLTGERSPIGRRAVGPLPLERSIGLGVLAMVMVFVLALGLLLR